GTLFHCKSFTLKGKSIELVALPDKKITFPLAKVAYVLNEAQDAKTQKEWQEIFADRGKRDRFFLRKEDGRLDGLEGTFGDPDPTRQRRQPQTAARQARRPAVQQPARRQYPGNALPCRR